MASVSLCMIVIDEEAVLARCLDSVKDLVEEIIIVDTGSVDLTKEIARGYTDKLYDFEWIDDFSAARNFSFSKARGDFIMWLDADDVLSEKNRKSFVRLKESILGNADVVMMKYETAFDEAGNPVFSYYRERLLRRELNFHWEGRVHEAISPSGRIVYSDVAVTHLSAKKEYGDRNLRIYESQISSGESLSPRDRFYYGRELYYHKYYDKAKMILSDFLSSDEGWKENNIEACKILSLCFVETDEPFSALEALTRTFRYDIPRAETCCEIGNIFMSLENYRTAAFWYELALGLPKECKSGAFFSEDCHGFFPCIQLCVCYDRLGEREKAERYNRLAGEYRPYSVPYLQNLKYFETLRSQDGTFS